MTEKELKRLSRVELLGLLLDEVKKNDALEAQVKDLQSRLDDRSMFETAKGASEQTADSIQKLSDRQEELFAKLEEGWQRINEQMEHIGKEQEALRSQIASGGKGARR